MLVRPRSAFRCISIRVPEQRMPARLYHGEASLIKYIYNVPKIDLDFWRSMNPDRFRLNRSVAEDRTHNTIEENPIAVPPEVRRSADGKGTIDQHETRIPYALNKATSLNRDEFFSHPTELHGSLSHRQIGRQSLNKDLSPLVRQKVRQAIEEARKNHCPKHDLHPKTYNREFFLRIKGLYPSSFCHLDWQRNFDILFNGRKQRRREADIWNDLVLYNPIRTISWLEKFKSKNERFSWAHAWKQLTWDEKANWWPTTALWLLLNEPKQALKFLAATNSYPYPPFNMLADCFLYLDTFYYSNLNATPRLSYYYHLRLNYCLGPPKWSAIESSSPGIRLFLKYRSLDDVRISFRCIKKWRIRVSTKTLLYFMDLFIKMKDYRWALAALDLIVERKPSYVLESKNFQQRCCSLLTLDTLVEEDGHHRFVILPEILSRDIRPNRHMLNIVLANVLREGEADLGWQVVQEMENRGMELDSYPYLVLLHDAVRRSDVERLDIIVRRMSHAKDILSQPYITSKMLHALYSLTQVDEAMAWPDNQLFWRMLDVYSRSHDVKPLIDLAIVPPDFKPSEVAKLPPSNHALVIMLAAYIRLQKDTSKTSDLFDRFMDIAYSGHESFAPLLESDYVFNVFLHSLRHSSTMLPKCVAVVNAMTRPRDQPVYLKSEHNRQVQIAKPTQRTWTILLQAFLDHKQFDAVERIRRIMLRQGLDFNQITWNMIVRAFASAQMGEETVIAVQHLLKEGWEINSKTIKAVGLLRNRSYMEKILNMVDSNPYFGDAASEKVVPRQTVVSSESA